MANVTFYLKDEHNKSSLIFARFSFNYYEIDSEGKKKFKTLKYSTHETINPSFWDKKKQRAKETKLFPQYPEFNQRLNTIENAIKDIYRKMLNDGQEVTPVTLKSKLIDYLEKEYKVISSSGKSKSFTEFIKLVIEETRNGIRIKKDGSRYQDSSSLFYTTTLHNLIKYEEHIKRTLTFSDINLNFYNKYLQYLNKNEYAINSIGGHIKNIKVFMKLATKRGLNESMEFADEDFRKIEEEVETIYLTMDELERIFTLDLSDISRLDAVRDMFLIGCFTGLRFSDLKQLRKEHFYDDVIRIETIKTATPVIIPLHPIVRAVCNKYEYNLPRLLSNSKMNDYLKEICKLAKIDEIILLNETRGGLKQQRKVPKYELVSAHTARRSFATNMYKAKLPTYAIRLITGHTTEKAFLKYIRIDKEENAKMMLEHDFFKLQTI